MLELTDAARLTAGIVLLTVVTIETGGAFMAAVVTGRVPATDFQRRFFRAGHAHAGVLVILGLVCLLLTEATDLAGGWRWLARTGVLVAAILMPAGFFLSVLGRDPQKPGRAIALLWVGAASLTVGLLAAGIGLISGGIAGL